ncbi:hypothetical protein BKD30_04085 [Tersicoccus phoenicis]|uniref:Uncharacterized protein n=1 Tax=Tersicoccus phoenicis TaxID=554083 RepID=A0A1R1LHR8_9MICC|nr:hypothetical protein [Tersicoccus phoenicis]OMH27073.1 hypothetical protein BKD30_04085 [Tersicoccus phoenicis]
MEEHQQWICQRVESQVHDVFPGALVELVSDEGEFGGWSKHRFRVHVTSAGKNYSASQDHTPAQIDQPSNEHEASNLDHVARQLVESLTAQMKDDAREG